MAKPSLDDLIDSVRKEPKSDPKKVEAEKKKEARKEALKNVPIAKKKTKAQKDKESGESFISQSKKRLADGRKKELARKKSEDTLASKTRSKELSDKKSSLEKKKAAGEEKKKKIASELNSAQISKVSSKDSTADAGTKVLGNALSSVGAIGKATLTATDAGEKTNKLRKKVVQKMKKNRGLKTGVSSTKSIKDRKPGKKKEKEKDPWKESMDWRDTYIPTEIDSVDIIKPEPLKASNWREEFLWEVDGQPKESKEKEKQIKPMTGKNTVTINPPIAEGIRLKSRQEFLDGIEAAKKRARQAAGAIGNWLNPPAKDSNEPTVRAGERTPNTGGINQPHIPSRGPDGKRSGSEDDGSVAPPKSTQPDTRTPDQKTTPADKNRENKPPRSTPPTSTPPKSTAPSSTPKRTAADEKLRTADKKTRMAAWAKANPKLAAAKKERDRTRGTNQTTNPLMKDMKSRMPAPKTGTGSTPAPKATTPPPKATTPPPKVTPIKVQPYTGAQRPTNIGNQQPQSRFKKPSPMRLTNSFSDWRGDLQLDEASFAIGPGHKGAQKTQKIYNKGTGSTNPNEKDTFLRRTGPQLPLAKIKKSMQTASYQPEGESLDEVLGGKPGDGYIGHPNLDIKNPLAKKQVKKEVLPGSKGGGPVNRVGASLGDRNMMLDRMRNRIREDKLTTEGAAWTKKSGKNSEGGLNEKGRKSYEKENPGSDLKAPSKKVGNPRRASFCARMKGMKKKLTSKKTSRDPDSRINKSLRAWNC
tara:strand:+ start:3927 stop:6191 length:2265 start_codon:yes stop_codon:yes gene_type:complete